MLGPVNEHHFRFLITFKQPCSVTNYFFKRTIVSQLIQDHKTAMKQLNIRGK